MGGGWHPPPQLASSRSSGAKRGPEGLEFLPPLGVGAGLETETVAITRAESGC